MVSEGLEVVAVDVTIEGGQRRGGGERGEHDNEGGKQERGVAE
jgi:hypothetical protein